MIASLVAICVVAAAACSSGPVAQDDDPADVTSATESTSEEADADVAATGDIEEDEETETPYDFPADRLTGALVGIDSSVHSMDFIDVGEATRDPEVLEEALRGPRESSDDDYFVLAVAHFDSHRDDALELLRHLSDDFPDSDRLPKAYALIGDHHAERAEISEALDAYREVLRWDDSPVYPYARLQKGWLHFNLMELEASMQQFLTAHEDIGSAEDETVTHAMGDATYDGIVHVHAEGATPEEALEFFRDIAEDRHNWIDLGERLARLYSDQGRIQESTMMYKELIAANSDSHRVVDYHLEMASDAAAIDPLGVDVSGLLMRTLELVQIADEGQFSHDEEDHPDIRSRVEATVRSHGREVHREAMRLKRPDLFVRAHHLYAGFLTTFEEPEDGNIAEKIDELQQSHFELCQGYEEDEAWESAASCYIDHIDHFTDSDFVDRAYENVLDLDADDDYVDAAEEAMEGR